MIIKINRREFDVSNKDEVFFNGCAYILTTKTYLYDWNYVHPTMGKTLVNKLIKENKLVLVKENLEYMTSDGKEMWYRYYRFNVEE